MNISFSTVTSNLKTKHGYGYGTQNLIKSLTNLGHTVKFQDPKCKIQVNYSQPINFKLHKNQYQIGYIPWESTVIPEEWKYYMNACDEIWTTSKWCANIFKDNGFKNAKSAPHGIDPIWVPKKRISSHTIKFLHIGEPAPRKAGQMTVDAFIELFGNKNGYSLTIKASRENTTRIYNNKIDKRIIGVPNEMYSNINLITDILTDEELLDLYNSHDVLIYPSYGEGFGFIPLQALANGMPVICTSGWADYENYLGPLKLKTKLIDSPWPSPHLGKVFEPNYEHLLELMIEVSTNFNKYSNYYFNQSTKVHKDYNWDQLTKNAFDHIFKKFS